MRILQLRLRNLNSLVGEWEIDLSHQAFTDDGIFAIVGPTGAGKTTLLDAICLALYGRTPRLPKITQGSNELMSRHCGDCFAEVSFAALGKRYRCRWDQRRAHKRPLGELQPARHEFVDGDTGKVLATGLRPVAAQVHATTGMGFDQFTRSMLLAQGDFAAFLKASADERAPILEHITGTAIYSKISIRVHDRRGAEHHKLSQLQAELKGIALLGESEEQQLDSELQQHCANESNGSAALTLHNKALAWLDRIALQQHVLDHIEQRQTALKRRLQDFAGAQEKLNAANRALELAADYAALASLRKQRKADHADLEQRQQRLPDNTYEANAANTALKAAGDALATQKIAQQQALPVIRKVRELDLRLSTAAAALNNATAASAERSLATNKLAAEQQQNSSACALQRNTLADLQQQLLASAADRALVGQLTGIDERWKTLGRDQQKLQEIKAAMREAHTALAGVAQQRQQQAARVAAATARHLELQATLKEKESQCQSALDGKTLANWRQQVQTLGAEKEWLTEAVEAQRLRRTAQTALTALNDAQEASISEEAALSGRLSRHAEQQAAFDSEAELLHTQLQLLHKIARLEDHRGQLKDGEQCPLCGARHHPFAIGNVPKAERAAERLAALKAELKRSASVLADTRVALARVGKDLEQQANERQQQQANCDSAQQALAQAAAQRGFVADDPELEALLQRRADANQKALANSTCVVHSAENLKTELDTQNDALSQARVALIEAEHAAERSAHDIETAEQSQQRRQHEADTLHYQQQQALARCRQEALVFSVAELTLDNLAEVLAQLTERRALWLQREQQKTALLQAIATLEARLAQQSEQLQQAQQELGKQQAESEALDQQHQALVSQRERLFSDKQPDAEERCLATVIDSAEQHLTAARQRSMRADQELAQLQSQVADLKTAIATRDATLQQMRDAFRLRLTACGFADEDTYRAATLAEEERKTLAQQAQQLKDEDTALGARQSEAARLLATERRQSLTDLPREGLSQKIAVLAAEQQQLQQHIGGLRQRLKENAAQKQQQQQRLTAIAAQQQECARWDLLHQLLGSADGKKYRNFAQGLTFEIMVAHANRQLQRMSDRYLLTRAAERPLELDVIDNYQAGEVRSTDNLSGGESFIVSLSLALGLSSMTSNNVRVDSLFLDEGFGTLDEETLDTALETLAGLRQEGKLIGVISHVPMLKDRIPTHIQVIPKSNGQSIINGPGCRHCHSPATHRPLAGHSPATRRGGQV